MYEKQHGAELHVHVYMERLHASTDALFVIRLRPSVPTIYLRRANNKMSVHLANWAHITCMTMQNYKLHSN